MGGFNFSSSGGFGPGGPGGFDPFSTFNSFFGEGFNVHNHSSSQSDFNPYSGMGSSPFGNATHSQSFSMGVQPRSQNRKPEITGVTATIEHDINVTLEELATGTTKKFNIKRDRITNVGQT